MAFKRVLVLLQVVVASLNEDKHNKYTKVEERVCAGRANARHSFSFFSFVFSVNEYSLLSRLKCMSNNTNCYDYYDNL